MRTTACSRAHSVRSGSMRRPPCGTRARSAGTTSRPFWCARAGITTAAWQSSWPGSQRLSGPARPYGTPAIEYALHRPEPRQRAVVHLQHVSAERLRHEKQRDRVERDLQPSLDGHVRTSPVAGACRAGTGGSPRRSPRRSPCRASWRALLPLLSVAQLLTATDVGKRHSEKVPTASRASVQVLATRSDPTTKVPPFAYAP